MIAAGELEDRVTIERQALTDDGQGGKVAGAWSALTGMARIAAKVEPLEGEERIAAMQTQAGVTHTVLVRHRAGVKARDRIIWHANDGDRTLHLTSAPVVVGRNEGLRMMARQDAD